MRGIWGQPRKKWKIPACGWITFSRSLVPAGSLHPTMSKCSKRVSAAMHGASGIKILELGRQNASQDLAITNFERFSPTLFLLDEGFCLPWLIGGASGGRCA